MSPTDTPTPPRMAQSPYQLDALDMPAADGRYGDFGGSYIPEVLVPAVARLTDEYLRLRADPSFHAEYGELCRTFIGRPTPLQNARRLTDHARGAHIMLKREDLAHTGSHKINNAIGQALIAKRLGLRRIIAETGAGQHGVATATACALLGLECVVYMGAHDVERQHPNVERMQLLGADVRPVDEGARTLKDAINAAIRDWITNVRDTYYLIGSAVGMHPYPLMVRDFQSVIGHEIYAQTLADVGELPDALVACVGGGSNAIGTFSPFIAEAGVELYGAEAGGRGPAPGDHGASISCGVPGVLHGAHTMLVQDGRGQVAPTHSISAGLDYPGVGPEHAQLAATGRATYMSIDDATALEALRLTCRLEGIIPALESSHAIALALRLAADRPSTDTIVVTVSGRGDKDMAAITQAEETS